MASAAQPAAKELPLQEAPCIAVSEKTRVAVLKNPLILSPPEAMLRHPGQATLEPPAVDVARKPQKEKEPEWQKVEVDCTKLHKYCLMLSKIRLTSRYLAAKNVGSENTLSLLITNNL